MTETETSLRRSLAESLRRMRGRLSLREPMPPKRLWPLSGSFAGSAHRDLRLLIDEAQLRPSDRVLDVGCGLGRMALPLKGFLDDRGRYEGFDVREKAIRWARRRIGRGDSRIRFRHIDIFNRAYNPTGAVLPSELRFPYDDGSFDLVVLFSVFTHLVPEDMHHYLAEVVRVLVPGGRCVATFRLLDQPEVVKHPEVTYEYSHDFGDFLAADRAVPERAIAYREAFVRQAYEAAGLEVVKVRPGRRATISGHAPGQDMVIARRP